MRRAILFEKLEGEFVRCTACAHYCRIMNGMSGACGVRKNIGGELYLSTYGKAVAANNDPIEKKPLNHFLPGTTVFSIGTLGCNFSCDFCQNWDISQAMRLLRGQAKGGVQQAETMLQRAANDGMDLPPERIVQETKLHGSKSIAFTYNEPTIAFEYARDTFILAKKEGLKTVFVSNGFQSKECMEALKGCGLDAIRIDVKSFNENFYRDICKARLEPVLESVKLAHRLGLWVEIITLVIPGKNDSDEELKQIAEFVAGVDKSMPWHVTAFHPDYKMANVPATQKAKLERAWKIGKDAGLEYVYIGNVDAGKYGDTYCPKCNELLIKRDGFSGEKIGLVDGMCRKCKNKIAGVWS
ncbi:Radical SAM superfamily protein [Candidatus Gugararchaeum adminiculabundum]|nr:Radical SAM superfamily protein [Candidatus Gugararchaeum adminiculabundum]